jgi:type III pantothenate kinase
VGRIKKEIGASVIVVATGGLAGLMKNVSESIEIVEPFLTLEGLRIISESLN